jgi:hypothetical protein
VTEQDTIRLLVDLLAARDPFVHVRFGDGDIFFMSATGPQMTADGEEWSPGLQAKLVDAFGRCVDCVPRLLLGDIETYDVSDGCEDEWLVVLPEADMRRDGPVELVHMEALRAARGHALPLYKAIADDPRRKMYVAPDYLRGAATMLGADLFPVPLRTAYLHAGEAAHAIASGGYEVALFSAGRGGKVAQGMLACRADDLVQIDVGSGLDLMFGGVRRGTDAGVTDDRIEALRQEYRDAGMAVEP